MSTSTSTHDIPHDPLADLGEQFDPDTLANLAALSRLPPDEFGDPDEEENDDAEVARVRHLVATIQGGQLDADGEEGVDADGTRDGSEGLEGIRGRRKRNRTVL